MGLHMQQREIIATVALPTYNSASILWLALEGLCRQQLVDHWRWELLVCEEPSKNYAGEGYLDAYRGRLKAAGCDRIKYIALNSKIPLGSKWSLMARRADASSKVFVLCASDNYSFEDRLSLSILNVTMHVEWWQCQQGHFLNINTGEMGLYSIRTVRNWQDKAGLFMACNLELARLLPREGPEQYIDAWMYRNIKASAGRFRRGWTRGPLGLHTDGHNTISHSRRTLYGCSGYRRPFVAPIQVLRKIVPGEVAGRLEAMKL